jgi:hypothetical protein
MPNLATEVENKPTTRIKRYSDDDVMDWHSRIANLAAEMKAGGGPLLDEINR